MPTKKAVRRVSPRYGSHPRPLSNPRTGYPFPNDEVHLRR